MIKLDGDLVHVDERFQSHIVFSVDYLANIWKLSALAQKSVNSFCHSDICGLNQVDQESLCRCSDDLRFLIRFSYGSWLSRAEWCREACSKSWVIERPLGLLKLLHQGDPPVKSFIFTSLAVSRIWRHSGTLYEPHSGLASFNLSSVAWFLQLWPFSFLAFLVANV